MSIPKWRYVRYTDDGCAAYQCLNCYKSWEGRGVPGYFDQHREVPEPVEGCMTYLRAGVPIHIIKIEPVYIPCWQFCPYCGIEWEGPVRCDVDNEYMYGPDRLAKWQKIQDRYNSEGWQQPKYTRLWWVIVERDTWRDGKPNENWTPKKYARVDLMSAAKILYLLREWQEELNEHNIRPGFCDYEAKIVTTFVQPKSGYEIRNYD